MGRDVQKFFRHEQRDEGHHLKVGLKGTELLPNFRLAIGRRLAHRQFRGQRGFLQRIGLGAFLLRRDIRRDDIVAALEQRLQHGFAERLLAVNNDTHSKNLFLFFTSPRVRGEVERSEGEGASPRF